MNHKRRIALFFLLVLMASAVVPVYATKANLKINVHAKAVKADSDNIKNDIEVSGNIRVSGMEDTVYVELEIEVERPGGDRTTQYVSLEQKVRKNGNTVIKYEVLVKDFATVKGMYYVTVTASSGGLTASADFKWDPPGGGGGPPGY